MSKPQLLKGLRETSLSRLPGLWAYFQAQLPAALHCSILLVLNGELFVFDPVLVFCSVDLKIGDFLASWSSLCLGTDMEFFFSSLYSAKEQPHQLPSLVSALGTQPGPTVRPPEKRSLTSLA